MKEPYPVFSGPGHILLLYLLVAFCISVPDITPIKENLVQISAGIVILGLPLGSLINVVYHSIWNLRIGYDRIGHCKIYYDIYKADLDKETILAIHDKMLWDIAKKKSIEYFRRRWAHYHFGSQIMFISLISISFPLIFRCYFNNFGQVWRDLFLLGYCLSLLSLSIILWKDRSYTSKSIQEFITQLFKGSKKKLKERLDEEVRAKE
ncbi:MAG: hypothetical protein PVF58_01750 [Candidatus Methanofastidiosia archaeon]|jgi:hypothetical protein